MMVVILRGVPGQEVEPPLEEGPPPPKSTEDVTPLPLPLPHIQVGGRLAHFAQNWQKVTSNKWVLSLVKTAYRIPFIEQPPLSVDPIFFQQSLSPQLKGVSSLLQKGAVEEIQPVSTLYFQFFGAVFASKGYPFKNIFDFTTTGDWDCVAAVERLPALHYSVDFIFLSFGIMGFIVEL